MRRARGRGRIVVAHRLGQAEVEHFHFLVWRDLDVGGFEIAMDDAFVVRGFERVSNLMGDAQDVIDRHRPALQALGERLPLDEFHDQEVLLRDHFHAEERGDVRVVECGERFGFALEARDALWIEREGLRKNLDGDFASELGVAGAVHLAHAAGAERPDDL